MRHMNYQLYVTVWLDDQGNIIKDAVEDAKTPASERQRENSWLPTL